VIIAGGASVSDTISFPTTNKLNGVYGATMTVGLQNEQDIQGAAVNDLPAAVISLQATITSNANTTGSPEAGTYTFGGGTLVAPATNLTGSFTQTGGASSFVSIAGTGSVNVGGGTATIIGGPGGPALIASSLAITSGGKVVLSSNASQGSQSANPPSTAPTSNVKINSLSISGAGTLDIGNNHLIINYGSGADPIGSIAAWIADGAYGSGTAVTWTGTGITSSAAASNPNYGIGYADANDAGNPAGLASGQIEVMYTLLGDANLDGKVNGTDFNLMATNFNQSVTAGWDKGDFNYDGKVNGNDFVLLAANFNQFASQSAVSSADITALDNFAAANGISLASVPEPAIASLMFVAGFGVLRRRRRASR
jgi:hypothetical protein